MGGSLAGGFEADEAVAEPLADVEVDAGGAVIGAWSAELPRKGDAFALGDELAGISLNDLFCFPAEEGAEDEQGEREGDDFAATGKAFHGWVNFLWVENKGCACSCGNECIGRIWQVQAGCTYRLILENRNRPYGVNRAYLFT